MRSLTKLAIVLVLGGCGHPGGYGDQPGYGDATVYDRFGGRHTPTGYEMIWTDADAYDGGTRAAMRLTNRTGRTVTYNLCRSQLQRHVDNEWRAEKPSLAEVCTAELRTLRPGQAVTFQFAMPGGVRNGTYRIRTELHDPRGGPPAEALSNTFTLITRERND
jgi:hypothetical protein